MPIRSERWLARAQTADGPRVVRGAGGDTAVAVVDGAEFGDLPDLIRRTDGDWSKVESGRGIDVSDADLLNPVADPRKVICVGLNYLEHAEEAHRETPPYPMLFPKWASSLTDPYAVIDLPPESEFVDWESELAVVIGRECRRVSASDAESVLFGYSIANDVTMRDWQRHTRQMAPGKAWDRATPLGPAVVPVSRLGGARPDVSLEGRLNGALVQKASTSQLVHDIPALIEYVTTWTRLEAGDVILTGTCAGVGWAMTPRRRLQDGDVFEVSIEGIGSIANEFRTAAATRAGPQSRVEQA